MSGTAGMSHQLLMTVPGSWINYLCSVPLALTVETAGTQTRESWGGKWATLNDTESTQAVQT